MDIKDRDVREALKQLADAADTLKIEYSNKEAEADGYSEELSKLDDKVEELQEEIESLKLKIEELEEALAEAYLTDEAK